MAFKLEAIFVPTIVSYCYPDQDHFFFFVKIHTNKGKKGPGCNLFYVFIEHKT